MALFFTQDIMLSLFLLLLFFLWLLSYSIIINVRLKSRAQLDIQSKQASIPRGKGFNKISPLN